MVAIVISVVALGVAISALVFSLVQADKKRIFAEKEAKAELGRKYARMAWAYAKTQPDSAVPPKVRKHAQQAFVIIDKAADGSRDFDDQEVAFYVDESDARPGV